MPRLDTPTPEPESSSSSSSSSDGEFDEESLHDTNSHAYVPATTDAHQGYVPLTNETKRKAEYAESYGQLAKIPRQESPFSAEAWLAATANQEAGEVRDDDDDYDDGGGDGDGDGDDVDSDDDADDNTNGNVGEDLAINMAPHVQPITHNKPLQLHPSFPRSEFGGFRHQPVSLSLTSQQPHGNFLRRHSRLCMFPTPVGVAISTERWPASRSGEFLQSRRRSIWGSPRTSNPSYYRQPAPFYRERRPVTSAELVVPCMVARVSSAWIQTSKPTPQVPAPLAGTIELPAFAPFAR